jgi:hypothetical protein
LNLPAQILRSQVAAKENGFDSLAEFRKSLVSRVLGIVSGKAPFI